MRSTSPELVLEALDPEQRSVALALEGPVRVLAGAGTGKTRAITHRIAYGVATGAFRPTEVLAVTFTARAAGELRTRLRGLGAPGVQARTFHSAALRQARYFWPRVYGGDLPQLMDSKLQLVGRAVSRNRLQTDGSTLRDLAGEIEWAKVSNVRPEDYPSVAPVKGREVNGLEPDVVARVFGTYEDLKREAGRMDMEDILLCAAALLSEDDRVAAEVRSQYRHFVVDEFQDVSPVQMALLELWLGGRNELCVVGDPAQTIYSFAGADANFLVDFPKRFPGTTSIELVRNYRSTPQVVEVANRLLAGSRTKSVTLRAQRPAGTEVSYLECSDEVAEAASVAGEIKTLLASGVAASEIAVLFRINAQSEAVEEALAELSIPYVLRGAERFFQRAEVRQAITLLRGAARAGTVEDVPAVLASMGWSAEAPAGRGAQREAWESLRTLVELCAQLAEEGAPDLAALVAELERRAEEQHAPVADGVTVATLHTAKGLEWDAVFLVGVHDGTIPIVYAETPEAIEEERRLLYVGMTRARQRLRISWSRARTPGGRGNRGPSRFLDGIAAVTQAKSARRPAKQQRGPRVSHCRVCGDSLGSAPEVKLGRHTTCEVGYDEALLESLRSWRLERAKADSVPAYVVFTDTTLQAIAEQLPRDGAAMLKINGIGAAKLDKYGDEVLELLKSF
jgi:DNA helicase-2/ATP-dependent DNA helicase PcrA